MKFKGTKGKWQIADNDETFVYALNDKNTNAFSLSINNDGKTSLTEQKANALLISKAPEMLEMLNKVLMHDPCHYSDTWHKLTTEIEKLIKEATKL